MVALTTLPYHGLYDVYSPSMMKALPILLFLLVQPALAQPVVFVKHDATGSGDGTSWADAFTDLQQALQATDAPAEIWIAAGTYKPTTGTDRAATFTLRSGIALYGGFAGWETNREERDWALNETILSGEIGNPTSVWDNSCHVLTATDVDATALLDGLTITKGQARGCTQVGGGGLINTRSSPTIRNTRFHANLGGEGGGIYNREGSKPVIEECLFDANHSVSAGSGMANNASSPSMRQVRFLANTTTTGGGAAMLNVFSSHPTCVDCTFEANDSGLFGAVYNLGNSRPVFIGARFTGNTATYGGAVYTEIGCNMVCIGCTFERNRAIGGGAFFNSHSGAIIIHSRHLNNSAVEGSGQGKGGAIHSVNDGPYGGLRIIGSVFAGNRANIGGAISILANSAAKASQSLITGSTIAGNFATVRGGALYLQGPGNVRLHNSILWGNTPQAGAPSEIHLQNNIQLDARHVIVEGGGIHGEHWTRTRSSYAARSTTGTRRTTAISGFRRAVRPLTPEATSCCRWTRGTWTGTATRQSPGRWTSRATRGCRDGVWTWAPTRVRSR
jgi:predicted outer membrane repeat protein